MKADLLTQMRLAGLPAPTLEHRFHPQRKWRFDYCWPACLLAVELEGGLHLPGGGRHNRARGFQDDIAKYNAAVLLGWRLLRITYPMLRDGRALALIEEALALFSKE